MLTPDEALTILRRWRSHDDEANMAVRAVLDRYGYDNLAELRQHDPDLIVIMHDNLQTAPRDGRPVRPRRCPRAGRPPTSHRRHRRTPRTRRASQKPARTMIVKMTGMQRRALLTYAPEPLAAALETGSTQTSYARWHIEMPAIAWKLLLDSVRPRLYGPRGGFREATKSLRLGVMKAQNELSRLEHHPALTHGSLMGWHHEAIPVWPVEGVGPHTYSIYPTTGPFQILVSHHQKIRGHEVTTWAPGPPESGCLTHQEGEHLVVPRRRAVDISQHLHRA